MKTQIRIKETNRNSVVNILTMVLADETVLYIKTKNAHWNVEAPGFYDKHLFFKTQFKQLDEVINNVAERIRYIGYYAPTTLNSYTGLTHLNK